MDLVPVGKCGNCGGVVSTPRAWFGVGRPPSTCESCGCVADEATRLPTMPMKQAEKHGTTRDPKFYALIGH